MASQELLGRIMCADVTRTTPEEKKFDGIIIIIRRGGLSVEFFLPRSGMKTKKKFFRGPSWVTRWRITCAHTHTLGIPKKPLGAAYIFFSFKEKQEKKKKSSVRFAFIFLLLLLLPVSQPA